jgi:uncharacterized membrane protein
MLAHLYRGEMYRSKVWRTRLDATTNWAVATTGIALLVAFSNAENSSLPLVLVALLDLVFLAIEARRYRYFDIWRHPRATDGGFNVRPASPTRRVRALTTARTRRWLSTYERLRFHVSFWKRWDAGCDATYSFVFVIQAFSYVAKICIHSTPFRSFDEL